MQTESYERELVKKVAKSQIDRYRATLEKDNFQATEPHWRRLSKNTITLFQVLIDQDLKDLVLVLEHYPRYIEWVCEHFRYAYSYSENSADILSASKLLFLGEEYFSKQFVRNLVRKLPKIEDYSLEEIKDFTKTIKENEKSWHSIIINYYCLEVEEFTKSLHPLQKIALLKEIKTIDIKANFNYDAQDRDAVLDIPYMN